MRLTGKFALVAALVAAMTSSILAAGNTIKTIEAHSDASKVNFDTVTVTFADVTKRKEFMEGQGGQYTVEHTEASKAFETSEQVINLADGGKISITPAAMDANNKQVLTVVFTSPSSPPPTETISSSDVTVAADSVTITKPKLNLFSKLEKITDVQNLYPKYGSTKIASGAIVTVVADDGPKITSSEHRSCYSLSDKNIKICVHRTSTGEVTFSVGPSSSGTNNPPVETGVLPTLKAYAPLGTVFILALLSPVIMSYIHANIDPQGYQAGKDASMIPAFYKSIMADTEYASEDPYMMDGGEEDGQGEIRVDPNTGRPVRVKKNLPGASGADETDATDAETTDAYGVSIMAAVLMVPFLL